MPAHSAAARARGRAPVAPQKAPEVARTGALQALRAATRDTHAALDALLPRGLRTLRDYRRYLDALLPLADWLDAGWREEWPGHLRSWHAPERAEHLRHDIEALAAAPAARVTACDPLNEPHGAPAQVVASLAATSTVGATPAGWLGGCYVIEGSALGARLLARDLDGLALEHASVAGARRFIDHLIGDPGRWRRFTRLLDALPAADIDAATSGACAGFALVHAGLSGQGDAP